MGIFRQASLDRLSSPEQLDQLLEVTTPRGWLALVALSMLIAAAVVWSIFGSIPSRVSGLGILVNKGGLSSVSALGSGQLAEIYVAAGSDVKKGDRLAKLSLPDLTAELKSARANLAALEGEHKQRSSFGSQDSRMQFDSIRQQRHAVHTRIATARSRQGTLADKLQTQHKLLAEGLITDQQIQNSRDALSAARIDAELAESSLKELSVKETEVLQRVKMDAGDRQKHIDELKRKIVQLEEKLEHDVMVLSPSNGRVVEVRVATGSLVSAGTPIVLLEASATSGTGLEAIVYVPGTDGKQVRPGMTVEVSPSTVKREEYGAMRARVTSVSEFPSTQQAMLANLGNQELVASFFKQIDSPIELRVDILPSAATPSGFLWTSPQGPPQAVRPGTLCQSSITVRERAPMTLVVPLVREKLGL